MRRDVDRTTERRVGRGRTRHPAEHELVANTLRAYDRIKDIGATDPSPLEQAANVPVAGERQQEVLRFDRRPAEHPCLILGQQDQVVRLIGEYGLHDQILSRETRSANTALG